MSASDWNAQLQDAIALAQAGQRLEARARLEAIVAANPHLELAWLWLATVSKDRAERIEFLGRALALNPNNPTALQAYAQLTGQPYVPPAARGDELPPKPALAPPSRLSRGNALLILAVGLFAVATIVMAVALRGSGEEQDGQNEAPPAASPTVFTAPDTPTPVYSPTPSHTPRPSHTPGPSPTNWGDVPPPTWTVPPSPTPPPTRKPPATWTPIPTWTNTPSPTASVTPLPPADTPTASRTPNRQTQTAVAGQF